MRDSQPAAAIDPNPLLVEVTRGPIVESRHRGAVAVVDHTGAVRASWGDINAAIYPRSAIKSLQAIPLVESGAAARLQLSDAELALACSSHNGEPAHVAAAAAVLARLGLSESDLECGAHWPSHQGSAHALAAAGATPTQLHNNCSGKHAGMLAVAQALGAPTSGYVEREHPVQRQIRQVLEAMTGCALHDAPVERDGCSVPTWAIPLHGLALAFARLGSPASLPEARRLACERIRRAVMAAPFMVAGTGRYDTRLMEALHPRVFAKTGAEGVFCAAVPELGVGIALKCDDGSARGAEMMLSSVLDTLGVIGTADRERLGDLLVVPIVNWRGYQTGSIRRTTGPATW
jgi:L-asparaginase II